MRNGEDKRNPPRRERKFIANKREGVKNFCWEYQCQSCKVWKKWKEFRSHSQNRNQYLNQFCLLCENSVDVSKLNTKIKTNALTAQRRVATNQITEKAIKIQIENIYAESIRRTKETGIKHHVDHIIPINHSQICGLHTPVNLQILTETENLQKKNKFVPYREFADGRIILYETDIVPLSVQQKKVQKVKPMRKIIVIKKQSV